MQDTFEQVKEDINALDWINYNDGSFYSELKKLRKRLAAIPHQGVSEEYYHLKFIGESRVAFNKKDFRQAMSSIVSAICSAKWSFSSKTAILTLIDDYLEKEFV